MKSKKDFIAKREIEKNNGCKSQGQDVIERQSAGECIKGGKGQGHEEGIDQQQEVCVITQKIKRREQGQHGFEVFAENREAAADGGDEKISVRGVPDNLVIKSHVPQGCAVAFVHADKAGGLQDKKGRGENKNGLVRRKPVEITQAAKRLELEKLFGSPPVAQPAQGRAQDDGAVQINLVKDFVGRKEKRIIPVCKKGKIREAVK